jgi:uncharacterized protein (DUF1800 family)
MASDPKAEAALALHRFGLGPRAGSIAAIASDPRGAVLAELDRPGAGQINNPDLPTSGAAARAAFEFQQAQNAARQAARAAQQRAQQEGGTPQSGQQMSIPGQTPGAAAANVPPARATPPTPPVPQQLYLDEAKARVQAALAADIGVAERLVWFWSNHFCVSADKAGVRPLAGAFEREAIRSHALGWFGDMLLAVESHPAMLIYLDNARSIGPSSVAGMRQKRGLNENLAREILELHTLGVRSVYTQDDVTNFANVITGWTITPLRQNPDHGGEFTFNANMHQPGAQSVIGRSYAEGAVEQGRAVLATLAHHPATARHIATKLARHFIADEPPAPLVERLSKRFLDTQGDLRELTKTLITSPEAWSAPRTKLKRPSEWIVAALRSVEAVLPRNANLPAQGAGGMNAPLPDIGPVMQAQNLLGEPLWRVSAPKGFADESGPWLDGLAQRLDLANVLARRVASTADPKAIAEEALGPLASAETRQAISRAESRPQALALLFMSPEFQRR